MKKYLMLLFLSLGLLLSCQDDKVVVEVKAIELNHPSEAIQCNSIYKFRPIILPSYCKEVELEWNITNSEVGEIDKNGVFKAVKPGTTNIEVICQNGIKAKCSIEVIEEQKDVESISLDKEELTLFPNDRYSFKANISPEDAVKSKVYWRSMDINVAKINQQGELICTGVGKTLIIAYTENQKKDTCNISVNPILVEEYKLLNNLKDLYFDDVVQLEYECVPKEATFQSLKWESSNTDIATVGMYGELRAVGTGSATITGTPTDDYNTKILQFDITVKEMKSKAGFRISPAITVNSNNSISRPIYVDYFTDEDFEKRDEIEWTIESDQNVQFSLFRGNIIFNEQGYPSLDVNWRVKTGTAVVTAKRGDIISKCNVTINSDEYYVPVNFFDAIIPKELEKGNTGMITINLDEEVSDKSCYYYSSNESVCSVSDKGELKALTVGSSAITVYSKDLGKFVKKIIRVIE